jgi:hypothetical protein
MDKEPKEEKKEPACMGFVIPRCCQLGLPECPHRAKKDEKKKCNIGL